MSTAELKQTINKYFDTLDLEGQNKILELVQALSKPKGVDGSTLLSFAGTIEPKELDLMSDAIDQNCEKINPDEW